MGWGGALCTSAAASAAIVGDLHQVVKVPHGTVLPVADLTAKDIELPTGFRVGVLVVGKLLCVFGDKPEHRRSPC